MKSLTTDIVPLLSEPLIGVGIFRDRESYRATAEDTDQDAWYQRLRALLEADPEWEDGVILGGFSDGGRL